MAMISSISMPIAMQAGKAEYQITPGESSFNCRLGFYVSYFASSRNESTALLIFGSSQTSSGPADFKILGYFGEKGPGLAEKSLIGLTEKAFFWMRMVTSFLGATTTAVNKPWAFFTFFG